jgi:hypothetical protein
VAAFVLQGQQSQVISAESMWPQNWKKLTMRKTPVAISLACLPTIMPK